MLAPAAKSFQSCLTLCDPIDGCPPGSPSQGFSRQEHWSGLPFPSPMHACMLSRFSRVRLRCCSEGQRHQRGKSPQADINRQTDTHTHMQRLTQTHVNDLYEEERNLRLSFKITKCQNRHILNNFKFAYSKHTVKSIC